MVRVAIVGAGKIGERHLAAYRGIEHADVVGILEPQEGRRGRFIAAAPDGLRPYATFDELLGDPEIDVVDICSPTPAHFAQVSQTIAARKTVFCEKPLAQHPDEINELERQAAHAGVSLRVGYVYRFHPRIQRLKERLGEDALGTPRFAMLRIGGRGSHRVWKHNRAEGGGVLLDMASHMVDLAYWLFGPVAEVEPLYDGLLVPKREIDGVFVDVDADDLVVLRLQSQSGVEILIHADFLSPGFANSIEVTGDNGSALVSVISGIPDRYTLLTAAADLNAGETLEPGDFADMLARELTGFVDDVEAGRVVQEIGASRVVAEVVEGFMRRSGE